MKLGKLLKDKLEAKHVYTLAMVTLYIYLISRCVYQYSIGKGIYGCKIELLLITIFSLLVYAFSFFQLDVFNKNHKKRGKKKINNKLQRNIVFESCFLSLIITTFIYLLISYEVIYIDFYNLIPNQELLSIIGLAVLLFLIFFLIIYFISFKFFKNKIKYSK